MTGFLRRWFGGSSKGSNPAVEQARAEIDRLAPDRPALAPLFRWLRELLPDLTPSDEPPVSLSADAARLREKLASGVPLLRGETLPLDESLFRKRWLRACELLAAQQDDQAAGRLGEAM